MTQSDAKRLVEQSLGRPVDLIDWTHMDYGVFVILTEDTNIMPEGSAKTIRVTVFIADKISSQHIIKTEPV
jgi:hypothetical protein